MEDLQNAYASASSDEEASEPSYNLQIKPVAEHGKKTFIDSFTFTSSRLFLPDLRPLSAHVQVIRIMDADYGLFVWSSSIVLAEFIINNAELFRGKKILELGSGTCIAGLVACSVGADHVIFTDRADSEEILQNCRNICQLNSDIYDQQRHLVSGICHLQDATGKVLPYSAKTEDTKKEETILHQKWLAEIEAHAHCKIVDDHYNLHNSFRDCYRVIGHTWGDFQPLFLSLEQQDIIIAADIFYDEDDFMDIFATVSLLLEENSNIVFYTTYEDRSASNLNEIILMLHRWSLQLDEVDLDTFFPEERIQDLHGKIIRLFKITK